MSPKRRPRKIGGKNSMSTSGRIDFDALTKHNVKKVFEDHAARTRSSMIELDREALEARQRMHQPDTLALAAEVHKLKVKVKKLEASRRKR